LADLRYSKLTLPSHDVVVAVRSAEKARWIQDKYSAQKVSTTIVEDITADAAFDHAVQSTPPFDSVIHAASPFHFKSKDFQKEILDPAIKGTVGILKSIKAQAPSVKRVVITSSMAAVLNWNNPPDLYEENTWNPITYEEALSGPIFAYIGSKTFAEKAARDFVKNERANFTLATIHPPGVYGPPIHDLQSLDAINTSNGAFAQLLQGAWQNEVPENGPTQWVDVRDVALSHVRAMELPEAAGRRFITVAGYTSNAEVSAIVARRHPAIRNKLPQTFGKTLDGKAPRVDTDPAQKLLGVQFTALEDSVADTIAALAPLA